MRNLTRKSAILPCKPTEPAHSIRNNQNPSQVHSDRRDALNRKQFIESQGASCNNWTWSWSFVNHLDRVVIFGAYDINDDGNRALILKEDWAVSRRGKKQSGYPQSREHVRLVEEEGYKLQTFPMKYDTSDPFDEEAPAKIKGFTPTLTDKEIIRVGGSWYASDGKPLMQFPEELSTSEALKEGAGLMVTINQYERNAKARRKCIEHHGCQCIVCGFDFEQIYGALGRGYIHVHHVVPLAEIRREYVVNPQTDLVPICPNCHAMVHSTRPALSVADLSKQMARERSTYAT